MAVRSYFPVDAEYSFKVDVAGAARDAHQIEITIDGERVTALFKSATNAGRHYEVHVARLGFALGADVTAGENSGRKLMHDFVVLGLTNEGIKAGAKELKLPAESSPPVANSRSALAAWVTQAGQIEPIQAVGGWLQ